MFKLTIYVNPDSLDIGAEQTLYVRWPFIPRVGESIIIEKFPGHRGEVALRVMQISYDFQECENYVLDGQSTKPKKAGELGIMLTGDESYSKEDRHVELLPTEITVMAVNVAHEDFSLKGRYIGGDE